MWNVPSKERLAKIPRLYESEETPLKEKRIYLHFFIGGCDWYAAEYDGKDLFFGYAIINNDYQMAEWGYFSLSELKSLSFNGIEVDCEHEMFFPVQKAGQIENIARGNGWIAPTAHLRKTVQGGVR